MEIKINSYSKQNSLFSAIISFIIGAILYTNAGTVLSIVSISIGTILGLISLFLGGIAFFTYRKTKMLIKTNTIIAILTFILSIVFLLFPEIVELILGLTIGGWILLTGILRIINAIKLQNKNIRFITNTIISLLLIGLGIYTISSGKILIETAGIIMMISAGIEIIGYIINNIIDDDNEKTEVYQEYNKETKLIIDEDLVEEDTKEKNIKKETKLIVDQVEAEKIQKKTKRRKRKVKDINPK